jgi:hypothetical protein
VTLRHAALAVGAALVLGLGVYLFIAVRAQPPIAERPEPIAAELAPPSPDHPVPAVPAVPAAPAPAAAAARSSPVPAAAASPPARPTPVAPPVPDAGAAGSGDDLSGPKLDAAMAEANAAYDRADYDEARQVAARLLARQPGNVRMLRILVSASCIEGDSAAAQLSYQKLPPGDQAQMRVRCARYGVVFADKP